MTTTTPNMGLILPDVAVTAGPQWAILLDAALTVIDAHTHASGSGVQITPSGLNINADLSFVQNNATNMRTARLFNNSSITPGVNDLTCLYALNNELFYRDGAGNVIQITLGGFLDISANISTLTIKDTSFFLENFGDTSKQMRFNVSAIPTATTRIMSVPDSGANDTFVTQAATQTLTNKTLSGNTAASLISGSGSLTLNTSGAITVPSVTDTLVALAASQTLTNKVLSGNTAVTLISGSGTLTLPTSGTVSVPGGTDTLVNLSASQTLTNKTLTAPVIAQINTGSVTFTLPAADGLGSQVVSTNGSGVLGFSTAATYGRSDVATSATINALSSSTSLIRLTGSTTTTVNGITALAAGSQLQVYNVSSALITIANQNSSATAANRIVTPSGASVVLRPNWTADFVYDDSQSRWILVTTSCLQEWQTYTPALSAGYGSVTSNVAFYKVVGDSIFVKGTFTAGTVSGVIATVGLPSGYTINSNKLSLGNTSGSPGNIVGSWADSAAQASLIGMMCTAPGTSTSLVYWGPSSASGTAHNAPTNANVNMNTGDTMSYQFEVPI